MVQQQLMRFATGLLCLLAMVIRADAHAFLTRAEPRVGGSVTKVPTEVRLWFSEPLEPFSSSISVFDSSGKRIDRKNAHLDRRNRGLLCVSLKPVLGPGAYKVIWRVTSADTHVTAGNFSFQIVHTQAAQLSGQRSESVIPSARHSDAMAIFLQFPTEVTSLRTCG
jgi:copper resistance protein C